MENRLLYKYYANAFRFGRVFAQFQSLMRAITHKNPRARVLEIGTGTGGVTRYAIQALGSQEEGGHSSIAGTLRTYHLDSSKRRGPSSLPIAAS